jgi:hypothetical protein
MRWRKPGYMHDEENGTYWVYVEHGGRQPKRNALVYEDKKSRMTKVAV